MATITVELSEFQQNLSKYVASKDDVTVTRDGAVLGRFHPARPISDWHADTLEIERELRELGVTEDEIVEDFKRLRAEQKAARSSDF